MVWKLVAGREKDITFATALIEHGFVAAATWHERAELLDQPNAPPDYGHLGHWHDPIADRLARGGVFVMVLAASRHMFVRASS